MADREPTTGELRVELGAIRDLLEGISKSMLTRDLFEAYRDASNERIRRVEDDQKEWASVSTAAHVELDKDSKARHAETLAKMEAVELRLSTQMEKDRTRTSTKFKEQEDRQFQIEQTQKQARSSRVLTVAGWVIAGVVAIVAPVVVSFVLNGGGVQ